MPEIGTLNVQENALTVQSNPYVDNTMFSFIIDSNTVMSTL